MIKLSELRIGNHVEIMDKVEIVKGINWNAVYFGEQGFIINMLDFVKPIQLTDKIMLGIKGFEKVYNSKYTRIIELYNSNKMQLVKWTYKKEEKKYNLEINGRSYPHIEFLHQFQNLFFFLFNEELVFSSTEP